MARGLEEESTASLTDEEAKIRFEDNGPSHQPYPWEIEWRYEPRYRQEEPLSERLLWTFSIFACYYLSMVLLHASSEYFGSEK